MHHLSIGVYTFETNLERFRLWRDRVKLKVSLNCVRQCVHGAVFDPTFLHKKVGKKVTKEKY